ncbi:MAG TPA: chemotaxis protein CheB [Segetibacter sp.]|nr:chemotaxis protein CheB [Segetibacter sp.]
MQHKRKPAFIITIGASAGGLNAISEVVAQLPEELDAAVFVVIHLSRIGLGAFLINRLQKYTAFTCLIPKDGEEIEAGKIYIAPPDNHLLIKDGKVALRFGPAENRWRPSIDVLFRSAAAYHGNRVIGIILTGYLNDGTAGMSAIKKSNGYCIVQDPNQAEYPDMPISVLETMEVDYCVPLDKMGETILSIIQHAPPEIKVTQNEVLKEAQIAERTMTDIETVAQLGQQALYACPDCGGGLWDISGSEIKRFRCHIGHAYSEKDLLIKQEESIESTLWVALRMMEERKMLYKKISSDESNKGLLRLSISHEQKADELEEHILKLKSLLTDTQRDKTEK